MSFFEGINLYTFIPLGIWAIFAAIWYFRKSTNKLYLQSIPSGFTMAGVLGTFLGITIGLEGFDVKDVSGSIPVLLEGLKSSFYTSILGIMLAMITGKLVELKLLKKIKSLIQRKPLNSSVLRIYYKVRFRKTKKTQSDF